MTTRPVRHRACADAMLPHGPDALRRWPSIPFVASVLVLWAVGVLRLFYGTGSGEHDAFMMAAGVVRGDGLGPVLNGFCYAPELQFVFYYLARGLTWFWDPSSSDVLLAMNIAGAASALCAPVLFAALLTRLLGDWMRGEFAVLLFVASPLFFFLLSYGHPFHLALVVCLSSWLALYRSEGAGASWSRWLAAAAAVILQSAALMVRFEQVLLFNLLVLAMLAARWPHRRALAVRGCALVIVAVGAFKTFEHLLVADLRAAQPATGGLLRYTTIVSNLLDPAGLTWGVAHLLVEVGVPLLAGAGLATAVAVTRREWRLLLVLAVGLGPSVAVYLANPSPPRHFYVVAATLAVTAAIQVRAAMLPLLRRMLPLLLIANLFFPWLLVTVDGRPWPDRAVVTYNVIERTDRNRAQIARAFPFYEQLLAAAEHRRVVVFGSWVHFAQIASMLASEPSVEMRRQGITPRRTAIRLTRGSLQLDFVETYDPAVVSATVSALRRDNVDAAFLSLVEGSLQLNDLKLHVPAEIFWWSS